MPGHVRFEYDAANNIVFTEDDWEVRTQQDVDDFFALYYEYFSRLKRKAYMVSHIDKLLVHGRASEYYAQIARDITAKYVLGFARWGDNSWARMTVRTTSIKAHLAPRIHSTREEAVQDILKQQKAQRVGA